MISVILLLLLLLAYIIVFSISKLNVSFFFYSPPPPMRTALYKLILAAPETTFRYKCDLSPMEEVMFDVPQGSMCYMYSMCYRSNSQVLDENIKARLVRPPKEDLLERSRPRLFLRWPTITNKVYSFLISFMYSFYLVIYYQFSHTA